MVKKIIILMSHYNDNNNLVRALKSFDEEIAVDILIVDDGSKVKPNEDELQRVFSCGNLKLINLSDNLGCGGARNYGLKYILNMKEDYKYIGSMDSDDINKKNRITKQVDFLEKNEDTMLLGSWIDCIDDKGNFLYTHKYPIAYDKIKKMLFINSMVAHPTMVFRKEILHKVGLYPEKYRWSEDYAFILNVSKKFKVENIPESLLLYTIHSNAYSSKNRKAQVKDRVKIIWDNFYLGFYPIYGLLRNIPLIYLSRDLLIIIKRFSK